MYIKKAFKQEITPITHKDCFVVFDRRKKVFDFPLHYHSEYELNCIKNCKGLQRVVGASVENTVEYELLFTGPNLIHGWIQEQEFSKNAEELTLQFHANLFDEMLENRVAFKELKSLFSLAKYGIVFCQTTAEIVFKKLKKLSETKGLVSMSLLCEILQILIDDKSKRVLNTHKTITHTFEKTTNNRLYSYIQKNYQNPITLEDIAQHFNMSLSTFNRMIKKETGATFVTFLNDYRLGMAARKLLETDATIQYISQSCGFKNLSNFNKFFKKHYFTSPQKYREQNKGELQVI